MNLIFELFQYQFLVIALIGAIIGAAALSLISPFVVLKKVSYMGEALAHVSFAGIGLALLTGLSMNVMVLIVVVGIALVIGFISERYQIAETHLTTIFLSVSMALGIIFLSLKEGFTVDLSSYLFGNILLINRSDLIQLAVMAVLNLLFITFFFKELFYMSYNFQVSRVFKVPVRLTYYLFLVFIAVNIVLAVKIVGIILITAQFILPGLTALSLCHSLKKAIITSVLLSVISAITGFFFSYIFNLPSGAVIVLVLFILFLISLLIRKFRK